MTRRAPVVLLLAYGMTAAAQGQEKVNRDSLVLKDFSGRVADYVKVHKAAQADVHRLKPTNSPEEIKRYEHALAHRIRELRRGAVQGNLFTPEIAEVFRRLIGATMQGPEGVRIRESLQHAAPVNAQPIRVNSAYPDGLPLQSTPPSLLSNLPALPPEVEYRVVGADLIIRDVDANLVVDFIAKVVP